MRGHLLLALGLWQAQQDDLEGARRWPGRRFAAAAYKTAVPGREFYAARSKPGGQTAHLVGYEEGAPQADGIEGGLDQIACCALGIIGPAAHMRFADAGGRGRSSRRTAAPFARQSQPRTALLGEAVLRCAYG